MFQVLSDDGIVYGIARIWADIHIASPLSVTVISGYIIWALVLMKTLPGPVVEGPVTPNGNVPRYRDNGFACFLVTMISFGLLTVLLPRWSGGYSVTVVYDRFDEFLGTLTVFAHLLCVFLYVKGQLRLLRFLFIFVTFYVLLNLQCFDAVDWATGRAYGL